MKSGIFRKILLFILVTLLVNAILTIGVFTYTSRNVFANEKAADLIPRAAYIANMVARYQRGDITSDFFLMTINSDRTLFDSTVHIFDREGALIAGPVYEAGTGTQEQLRTYLDEILSGLTPSLVTTTNQLGIVVATPVYGVDASIRGAVFLTKSLDEVNTALSGLNTALLISNGLVFAVMLFPAFFGTRGFSKPLMQMSKAAREMTKGNFSVRANAERKDEIGQLGQSLNELSENLSHTISALMMERNRLRNVLDGLREGIVAVDSVARVTHCNPAAFSLLSCEGADAQVVMDCIRSLWPDIDAALLRAQEVQTVTIGLLEIKIALTPLVNAHGERFGSVLTLRDITEEVRLEQTRREYVANVSHELRTPIASVRGLAEALSDQMVKKEEDKQRYYGYILRESMRLSRLIDDLLELSRLQSGGVALVKQRFDLRPLLLNLEERFSAAAGDSGLSFALSIPETPMDVYSNPDRVEEVLVAFLDNAVKYAHDDGTVLLRVALHEDGAYVVSVENTGEIDPVHLPRLFDRFYKADTSHSGQGTGLGLSIAQQIMDLLNERIWAENKDGCACFRFTLHKEESAISPGLL